VLGGVLGPYGVHGWLKVRSFAEAPETLLGYATWWLKPARGPGWRECERVAGRMHSGVLIAQLRGVDSREAALAMKGFEIGVPRSALPKVAADEIYWSDLTGLAVKNRAGVLLGEVRGVTEHGAHPLLQVARPAGAPGAERLIPYVPAIVLRVDPVAGEIEVDWGEDY
jgi:16S rRNA processing protein RimM